MGRLPLLDASYSQLQKDIKMAEIESIVVAM
jgi:hypothetical protein